ncbi:MAG: nucleoside recognition protein [Deltaproteobacteria bacterium]
MSRGERTGPTEAPGPPGNESASVPGLGERVRKGLSGGFRTSLAIVRITFPLYVAVDLLKGTEAIRTLGEVFSPAMGLFGLPGEAAIAFVAAGLLNLYAAIAILVPLGLTPFQVTQCGLMMGIAHNLVVEGGVLRSTGTKAGVLTLFRIAAALSAGLLLHGMHLLVRA